MDGDGEAAELQPALDSAAPGEENAAAAGQRWDSHMGFARAVAALLFVTALPVALVTTNVRLLANAPPLYDYAFDHFDAEAATGLSRADLDATASALRGYFNNGEQTFYHTVTEDGLETPVLGARETRHMEDVKHLFVLVNRAQEASVVYVLVYVVAFFISTRDGNARQLAGQCLAGLALGAAVLGAVGIVAAFGFEGAFERFHGLVFTNDDWRLDRATDHLIQMFPEPFWRDATILLGLMCAIEGLALAAASAAYLMVTRGERRRLPASLSTQAPGTQAA